MINVEKKELEQLYKNQNWLQNNEFVTCVADILVHPKFQKMNQFIQHGETTTMQHCLQVAYLTYRICKYYHLDYRSAARGALLHDLFLYDWHTYRREFGRSFHGLTHPRVALKNANRFFNLNVVEQDIILRHMWPLTLIPPRFLEGFVVMYADKHCGLVETMKRFRYFRVARQ